MPKTRDEKQQAVQELARKFKEMKSAVFSGYSGLTVPEVTELRTLLRNEGVEYVVVKKTLLKRALAEAGRELPGVDGLEGGIAVAFGYEDEVAPARILNTFCATHEAVILHAGFVGDAAYDQQQVQALAQLPSRQELLATLLLRMQGPTAGFVNVLAGPLRGLLNVLKAKSEQTS